MLHHSRLLLATLPFTLAALFATQAASAQTGPGVPATGGQTPAADTAADTAAGPAADAAAADTSADIVVTGSYARSLAAATETKRQAGYGVDAINATDIGKFPAQNVAEALQLIPGVTITRPRG